MIQVETMEPMIVDNENSDPRFHAPINPFVQDFERMGSQIGKNVTIMFSRFSEQVHESIIVVNTMTGERIRLVFEK